MNARPHKNSRCAAAMLRRLTMPLLAEIFRASIEELSADDYNEPSRKLGGGGG